MCRNNILNDKRNIKELGNLFQSNRNDIISFKNPFSIISKQKKMNIKNPKIKHNESSSSSSSENVSPVRSLQKTQDAIETSKHLRHKSMPNMMKDSKTNNNRKKVSEFQIIINRDETPSKLKPPDVHNSRNLSPRTIPHSALVQIDQRYNTFSNCSKKYENEINVGAYNLQHNSSKMRSSMKVIEGKPNLTDQFIKNKGRAKSVKKIDFLDKKPPSTSTLRFTGDKILGKKAASKLLDHNEIATPSYSLTKNRKLKSFSDTEDEINIKFGQTESGIPNSLMRASPEKVNSTHFQTVNNWTTRKNMQETQTKESIKKKYSARNKKIIQGIDKINTKKVQKARKKNKLSKVFKEAQTAGIYNASVKTSKLLSNKQSSVNPKVVHTSRRYSQSPIKGYVTYLTSIAIKMFSYYYQQTGSRRINLAAPTISM